MNVAALATYRPAWSAAGGARAAGPDEDVATLAVAAGRLALSAADGVVRRAVLVTREPDYLEATTGAVVTTALGLDADCLLAERLGGGPAALAALADAAPGTLVLAVSPDVPAGAAAALVGESGATVGAGPRVERSLPARIRHAGSAAARRYDDPRLVREQGSRVAVAALAGAVAPAAVTGVRAADRRRLGIEGELEVAMVGGAAEPLFALAALLEAERGGRLVALEGAAGVAVDVAGSGTRLVRAERDPLTGPRPEASPAEIPFSLPAYTRAFDAKVGLRAARCTCGALSYPPRELCLDCGRADRSTPENLPREGEVYTATTIHTPIPGRPGPYSLAIVALDGVDVRVLAHVTDAPAGSVRIGDRGELVLRRVAVREGVPDYGYAFVPAEPTG